jgi:hypothetical protein
MHLIGDPIYSHGETYGGRGFMYNGASYGDGGNVAKYRGHLQDGNSQKGKDGAVIILSVW